jgi:GT2 family glycosyltransferase
MARGQDAAAVLALLRERPGLAARAALRLLKTGDPAAVWTRAAHVARTQRPAPAARPYFGLEAADRAALAARARAAERGGPLISLVTPLHDTPPDLLRACVASVLDQAYRRFELVLVDDRSRNAHTLRQARLLAASDRRVRLIEATARSGVSRTTNLGVRAARGAWTGFLDHDDELTPDALTAVAERLAAAPDLDAVYTDQLKIDRHGTVIDRHHKPDWSPLHLLGVMYVGHLLVVRTETLRALGGFDWAYDGVQDFELMLRLAEAGGRVGHIPEPLYKWRAAPGSLALRPDAKAGIVALQRRAVEAHLARRGLGWRVEPHPVHAAKHRLAVSPPPQSPQPGVSIVIPSRDQGALVERCLGSIRGLTRHPAYEIVVVDDATTDLRALHAFGRFGARVVDGPRPFNFSRACNAGAAAAQGELLLFLNNDTEVLEPDWLQALSLWFEDAAVGAVGPLLTYPDGRVQHAGVALGARGTADHVMRGFPADSDGYAGSLSTAREVSAVTGACLMVRRDRFHAIGGFCADYATHYQDADLCLRLRREGLSIVFTPRPRLIHHEGATRDLARYDFGDRALFVDRWREVLSRPDPFYGPWFDRERLDYALAG